MNLCCRLLSTTGNFKESVEWPEHIGRVPATLFLLRPFMSANERVLSKSWIWPLRLSDRFAARIDAFCRRQHDWQSVGLRWLICGVLIGAGPVLLSFLLRFSLDRPLTTVLMFPFLLGAVRGGSFRQCVGLLLSIFAAHSVTVILLTYGYATEIAMLIPFGDQYWHETHEWLVTGKNPEYELSSWVPAHVQALFGVPIASYVTFGGALFAQGLYQVDMMNVYVGNLLAASANPAIALGLGWHPWSMMRGIGFLLLGLEAVSWSLERLIRIPLSTGRQRILRCGIGIGFLLLDATVKLTCMEPVRSILQANLLEPGG